MKKKLLLTLAIAGTVQAAEIQPAWLYQDISPEAYIRVPQQWTLLFANSARDPSAIQPHWQTVQDKLALLPGTDKNLTPHQKTVIDDILAHNIGAVEIAVYLAEGGVPHILIGAQMDYQDEQRFLTFAQALAASLELEQQGDGTQGRLNAAHDDMHIAYRYDKNSGKHRWLASANLPENIDWTKYSGNPSESLLAAATQIDPQGLGFMAWVRNNPLMLHAATDNHGQWVKALQLFKTKSLSAGYAVDADGKPALQLNLEITPDGLRDFFPTQASAGDIAVHGNLESALAFTLPDSAGMQKILNILDRASGEQNSYARLKGKAQNTLGIDLDPLFNAFGTQWLILDDDFGKIYAIRKNQHWQSALDMLGKAGYLTLDHNDDSGITHARLSFAHLIAKHSTGSLDMAHPLWQAILRAPTHFYYQEEGDYLVIADLPQPLIDRKRTTGGNHIGAYWGSAQNSENNLLATLKIDHLARRHYYSRLQWLQYLADIANTDIDISSLPSAQMLNLPDKGYLNAQIQGDADNLRLKIMFENSALDAFQHQSIYGSAVGIATLGILSAIALPAYQDYVERARIAQENQP